MDRLARNLIDLQKMVDDLTARGVYVQFHKEKLTFTNEVDKMATLMLQIMGAVADFERALIKERQREGMAKAKQTGKHLGRNFSLSMKQVKEAQSMVEAGETKTKVAEYFGISRQSLYRNLDRSIIQDFESQK
jgi:DNA invertase Pin-like site-specific DNA recombinase